MKNGNVAACVVGVFITYALCFNQVSALLFINVSKGF